MDERREAQVGVPNPYAPTSPFAQGPNPYAAPISDTGPGWTPGLGDDALLASPWVRLGAAILDSFVYVLVVVPVMVFGIDFDTMRSGEFEPDLMNFYLTLALPVLAVAAVQWYLIATSGQTVGKKLVGVKIVKTTGEDVNFVSGVILRAWVPAMIGWVPFVGSIFGLVNVLFIFGAEHRCLHDMIAGTKVISV